MFCVIGTIMMKYLRSSLLICFQEGVKREKYIINIAYFICMDEVDIAILERLSENCRMHSTLIANELGVATSTVHKRIDKLHSSGIIKEFTIRVDPAVVGFNITTFIGINIEPTKRTSVIESLKAIEDVLEIYELLEPYDLLLKVQTFDVHTLKENVLNPIAAVDGIKKSYSILTTKCHKESSLSIRKRNPPL